MEKLSSKEFFEQLKTNSLKPAFALKGIVKKSDKDSEVLFAIKGSFDKWISIPATAIESAIVLKTFAKEDKTFTVVKLHLKKPTTPEGQVFYDLLSAMEKEEMKSDKCQPEDGGAEHFSACQGMKGHCGCHNGCGCGCHHCGCGCQQGGECQQKHC
jgi:hypothetical protein